MFSSTLATQTTSSGGQQASQFMGQLSMCMQVDNIYKNQVTLRNCGKGVIENKSLVVTMDDVKLGASTTTILEGNSSVVNISGLWNIPFGNHNLKISNGAVVAQNLVDVQPNRDGLVGSWSFDEGSGNKANDGSGNNNVGTLLPAGSEPTWVNGKFNKGLQFDGVNDYVDAGNASSLNITNAITIAAWIKPEVTVVATGGTITEVDGYKIHTFTDNGMFIPTMTGPVEVLVVAGGASGGTSQGSHGGGGGGGAGGLIYNASYSVTAGQAITVNVGVGGAAVSSINTNGNNGDNSSFADLIAIGGGGGDDGYRWGVADPASGGSGGGAGWHGYSFFAGVNGTLGQGNKGGDVLPSDASGGGGGGAGGAGGNGGSGGGVGGIGLSYSISGAPVNYSKGGEGGNPPNGFANGAPNTGNGGTGVYAAGGSGAGGSGIVIVRYPVPTIIGKKPNAYKLGISNGNITGYINNQKVFTSIIIGTYQHVALSYNGYTQKLYVNGDEKNSVVLSNSISTNLENVWIGNNLNGSIDEVRIWNKALAPDETVVMK